MSSSIVAASAQCTSSITATTALRAAARVNAPAIASNCSCLDAAGSSAPDAASKRSSTSRIGPYGRCTNCEHRPTPTRQRDFASDPVNSAISRDLPIPASPPTSTRPPRDVPASRRRSCRYDSSSSRPMNRRQTIGRTIIPGLVRSYSAGSAADTARIFCASRAPDADILRSRCTRITPFRSKTTAAASPARSL